MNGLSSWLYQPLVDGVSAATAAALVTSPRGIPQSTGCRRFTGGRPQDRATPTVTSTPAVRYKYRTR